MEEQTYLKMEFYHPLLDQMKNTDEAKKLRTEYSGDILTCAVIFFFSKKNHVALITFSAIITHQKITAIYIRVYIYIYIFFFFFGGEDFHQCMF